MSWFVLFIGKHGEPLGSMANSQLRRNEHELALYDTEEDADVSASKSMPAFCYGYHVLEWFHDIEMPK